MAFVNAEGEFTGCHCGNCADALVSAQKVFEETMQMNEGCTLWALMLAEALVTTAKAAAVSSMVNVCVEGGYHPVAALAQTMQHIRMINKAMTKVVTSEEGAKATHEVLLRAMGYATDQPFSTLEDIFGTPKKQG